MLHAKCDAFVCQLIVISLSHLHDCRPIYRESTLAISKSQKIGEYEIKAWRDIMQLNPKPLPKN